MSIAETGAQNDFTTIIINLLNSFGVSLLVDAPLITKKLEPRPDF